MFAEAVMTNAELIYEERHQCLHQLLGPAVGLETRLRTPARQSEQKRRTCGPLIENHSQICLDRVQLQINIITAETDMALASEARAGIRQ